jgi:hypothetical protein
MINLVLCISKFFWERIPSNYSESLRIHDFKDFLKILINYLNILKESEDYIKMYCCWYNNNHKRQVDFEIIKVERIKTITINQVI